MNEIVLVHLLAFAALGDVTPPLNQSAVAEVKAPPAEQVRDQVFAWLDDRQADEAIRKQAEALWQSLAPAAGANQRLDLLAQTFALSDARASELIELCSRPHRKGPLADQQWLEAPDTPPLEASNLRLYYARWLAHEGLYDELLHQVAGLRPQDVVDPASLLFYQSVGHHRLLNKAEGLAAIERLLAQSADCPRRYHAVARLMQADLEALEEETLDHISRRMDDIRRRLALGRAGQKVRQVEDDVIASLDKLIKELEEQQQQQQQASAGSSTPSGTPMPDSRLARARGAGDVNRRDLGDAAPWGELPPKKREEALQQIGKDFPAHYRDAIQQYFRTLAGGQEDQP